MSNDLDLKSIREVWQKQTQGNVYSQDEIFLMIRRKSITSVKWLFYISLLEIGFGMFVYIYFVMYNGIESYHKNLSISMGNGAYFIEGLEVLGLIINFYFLYLFFRAYKRTRAESTIVALTANIIKFKSIVTKFIYFNLGLGFLAMMFMVILFATDPNDAISAKNKAIIIVLSIVFFIIILILAGLYYYLLYGTFIRRLKNNLKALSEIK